MVVDKTNSLENKDSFLYKSNVDTGCATAPLRFAATIISQVDVLLTLANPLRGARATESKTLEDS